MSLLSKIRDYDRVCKALEHERQMRNAMKVKLDIVSSENETQKRLVASLKEELANCGKGKKAAPAVEVVTIKAPKPEKRRSYVFALQKQLSAYIREEGEELVIDVVAPKK